MTHAKRILALLQRHPGLDDDELSQLASIQPRQQVNLICRRLQAQGLLVRKQGATGKIGNFPADPRPVVLTTGSVPSAARASAREPAEVHDSSLRVDAAAFPETLLIIPCSGAKREGGSNAHCCEPIADDLPPTLASRLVAARRPVLDKAQADERQLMPAWQRNSGIFYTCAGAALEAAIRTGLHMLILSGGYGVLKACEPIGHYATRLRLAAWPRGLLEEVLLSYAIRHRLRRVRAFVSATTDYFRLVRRTPWAEAGIDDVVVLTPEATRGAMVKTPRAQGEAFAAFLAGRLGADWRSSDGLVLRFMRLG